MRADRLLAVGAAFALASLVAPRADAFCRTRTIAPGPDFVPENGVCFQEGVPLVLLSKCFPYHLVTKESRVIPNAVLSDTLARAFASWTAPNPTCTPGITPIELASVAATKVAGYDASSSANQNLVGVEDEWNVGVGGGADGNLALTTLTFNVTTGEVYDVDMQINGTASWSFEPSNAPGPDTIDLQSALTHEVGHVLGFAHTDAPDTVMYPTYEPGSIAHRTLAAEDQAAICRVYPNRDLRAVLDDKVAPSKPCDLAPGSSCSSPDIGHGCSLGTGPADATEGVALVALGLAAIRRRRRRSLPHAAS